MSESPGLWFTGRVCAPSCMGRWGCPGLPEESPHCSFLSSFQDALLSLGAVIHIAGFRRAVKEALSAVLPKVVSAWPHNPLTPQIFAQLLAVSSI